MTSAPVIAGPAPDPFGDKMQKVRRVLAVGEGFTDVEVDYAQEAGVVSFRAAGAKSFKMRRAELDARTEFEIAFYVATRMRRPPAGARGG